MIFVSSFIDLRNVPSKIKIAGSWFVISVLMLLASSAEAQVFYYHGRLMNAQGTPLNTGMVDFTVEIRSPNTAQCLLFSEKHSIDMTGSYGYFRLAVNGGSGTRQPDGGVSFGQLFSNGSAFTGLLPAAACVGGGTSYTPAATDGRALVLKVDLGDGQGPEPFAAEILQPSLFAHDSAKVSGYPATSLLRVSTTSSAPELTAQQFTDLSALIGGTSTKYMQSSTTAGAALPSLSAAPTSPTAGKIWYNSTTGTLQFANGTGTQTVGTGNGTVTQIVAGSGLTGGTITATGTIALASSGVTAGTYTKLVVDGFGRALSGGTLVAADLPSLDGSLISSGTISAARMPAFTGDVTSSAGSTTLTLATTSVTAGTYPKVTVDTKGRVTAGTSLVAADIPSLDWTKIGSGKPTTLTGYGITDGLQNAGSTPSIQSGLDASKPANGTSGRLYIATDTKKIYRDTGSAWDQISSGAGGGGTVTQIIAGTGLTGGTITSSGTIALANSGVTAGTYTKVTVDSMGRVTAGNSITNGELPLPNCTTSQTLTFNSVLGQFECSTLSVLASQAANVILAGPSSGANATPSYRALVANDLPTVTVAKGGTGSADGSITGTGALTFTAGGTNQNVTLTPSGTGFTILNGKVGIGTASPSAALDVNGTIKGGIISIADPGTTGFDWSQGNTQYTAVSCTGTTWNFSNLSQGANYTLVVQGNAHTDVCQFSDGSSTFKYHPANAMPVSNRDAIYSFMKVGSVVYVSWVDNW